MIAINDIAALLVLGLLIFLSFNAWEQDRKLRNQWKHSFCKRLLELAYCDNLEIDYETAMDKAGQYIERFSDWDWILPEEAADQEYEAIIGSL